MLTIMQEKHSSDKTYLSKYYIIIKIHGFWIPFPQEADQVFTAEKSNINTLHIESWPTETKSHTLHIYAMKIIIHLALRLVHINKQTVNVNLLKIISS